MHNRIFRQPAPTIGDKRNRFVDVSSIAFASAFPFRTYVSRLLLRSYTISGIADDDEGRLFVEGILGDILAAITGTLPASTVSYGSSFSIDFEFAAQHRRRSMPEILTLRAFFGPWHGDPEVYVWTAPDPGLGSEGPEESFSF